ncbi:MAG: ABC transporter ATP-binding protein/permease [Clostridiales bacterium]|nr:ABC transporter ATP-binding protein/permease [Clostridiales bacterium]
MKTKTQKKRFANARRCVSSIKYAAGFFASSRTGGLYIFLRVLLALLDALVSLAYTVIPGLIINSLVDGAERNVIIYVALLAAVPLINHVKDYTLRRASDNIRLDLRLSFQMKYQSYTMDLEYALLEDPAASAMVKEINSSGPEIPFTMLDHVTSLINSFTKVLALSTIIAYLNPAVVILLLGIIFVNAWVTKKIDALRREYELENRKLDNIFWTENANLNDEEYGMEMRLFRTKDFFIKRYMKIGEKIDELALGNEKASVRLKTVHALTSALQEAALYATAIYGVIKGTLAVGSMTIFISAAGQFSGTVSSIFNSYLEISAYSVRVEEIESFCHGKTSKENSGDRVPEYRDDSVIEFHDVSFKYPGSDRYALRHLSIKLEANKKLCIVGENGSGKTTFIKLLTRLYLPTEGEITLDGVNIREFDPEKYQRLFAPVFQDYNLYDSLPIALNTAVEDDFDRERLEDALDRAGLEKLLCELTKGVDTYVGKSVDPEGFEPSGGEGQKIAIARAIYHDAPIYLLDEPTAALDPFAEYEIYKRFDEMITNRGAVLVTHRMSAVKLAENIAVFHDGNIIEYGTHSELYAKGGIYTEMFDKQAEFYREA